ncbi:LOW QUALITY PROTEIN: protein ALTERED SEED GERMINATION 2 [Salvia miltiorrhiza]|uniref:LOW QUALITY PROTEIN: protein ALTERED SEED GERMINATION 2 n=1 Tax=Salvia miltiorrhiza TaxID=226208 RepID=UPI0025ACF02F|nr:LOW QUALITY PROTEIN: protein ALTERED SEED GERMINATION 2 [Salvia miltiorrhiza]
MDYSICFHDGSITDLINSRTLHTHHDFNHAVQMHSSLVRRLSLERELEGHRGCVNAIAWNSEGSMLISGSDDTRVNVWSYSSRKLMHSIETGHSANIFCTKFVPETSDELVVSGAADAEVRLFNLSRLGENGLEGSGISPSAVFQCHTRRVKKLAVEAGNPNLVWSASEDGTLRQHDFREGSSCPPAGSCHQECRNVLLDLRCGAKKSLADPPKQSLALKSCDISSTRPHLLLVGGSDAFARLYDRRMLPPLSSSQNKLPPPPCVNYFCPMHLSDLGHSSLHPTHVTFSPNGEEVLLSYSGEHVYLMDINHVSGNTMRYTSTDVSKLTSLSPILNKVQVQSSLSGVSLNGFPVRNKAALDKCRKLIRFAEKSLKGETDRYYGIEACNEVLDGHGYEIGSTLMQECLCIRASLLLKRRWKNDSHMAIRDCHRALNINPSSTRALICMAEALSMLEKHKEALEFAFAAQTSAPSDFEIMERVEHIKKSSAVAEAEKTSIESDRRSRANYRARRVLSLSDIIYHTEGENDAPSGHEREDSDYDDELELDFETLIPAEGGHDVESNVLPRNLNLRIHRRGDLNLEPGSVTGSCGLPVLSCENDKVPYRPEMAIDMKQRYVGHCNTGTDIKQASFIGQRGEYVASGSDDGRWFIWEKKTGRLLKMLHGDDAVVNCIQCHPYDCVIATSGIDSTIKIWTPNSRVPSNVAGEEGPEPSNVLEAMEENQRRLYCSREAILPFEILERFRMHDFAEGSFHPFECTQS